MSDTETEYRVMRQEPNSDAWYVVGYSYDDLAIAVIYACLKVREARAERMYRELEERHIAELKKYFLESDAAFKIPCEEDEDE